MIDWMIMLGGLALVIGAVWLIRWMFAGPRNDDEVEIDRAIEAAKRHHVPNPKQGLTGSHSVGGKVDVGPVHIEAGAHAGVAIGAAPSWPQPGHPISVRQVADLDPEALADRVVNVTERREERKAACAALERIADGELPTLDEIESVNAHFPERHVRDAMVIGMWTSILRHIKDMAPCPPLVVDDCEQPKHSERIVIAAERTG